MRGTTEGVGEVWARSGRDPLFSAEFDEKRVGEQRERDMMMPSAPGASFEVVETELVLQLLVGVFDPPAILDHPDEVLLRRRLGEIGEEKLRWGGCPDRPLGDQPAGGQRLGACARAMGMSHPPDGKATRHRPLAALPPGHLAKRLLPRESPFGHALRFDRSLDELAGPDGGPTDRSFEADLSEILPGIDHLQRAVDPKAPLHPERIELATERRDRSVSAVGEHRSVQAAGACATDHLKGDLPLRTIASFSGYSTLFPAYSIVGPRLRQIEIGIDAEHAPTDLILERDGDLAVADLAEGPAVLAGHAHRVLALLDEAGVIDDQRAGMAKRPADPLTHRFPDDLVLPVALVDELLERLDVVLLRLIDGAQPLGHRLDALPLTVEQKAAKVRLTPELPLAAADARRDVGHVRLEIPLQLLQDSCLHDAKSEEKTDLPQDQLT